MGRKSHLHVERAAQIVGLRVNVEYHVAAITVLEHLPLDHAHRHLHQRDGMTLVAAVVAGDVEHSGYVAARIEHRRRGTSEEMVLADEVVRGVDHHRFAFDDRGTDGVGALLLLGPGHAGLERDVLGPGNEIRIAHRMQDEALVAAQEHYAARSGELVVEIFHHGSREIDQAAVLAHRHPQLRFIDPPDFANAIVGNAESHAALPRPLDEIRDYPLGNDSLLEELSVGTADRRDVGVDLVVIHTDLLSCPGLP